MSSVNKVIIVGNLGQNPEIKTFSDGGRICNISVATSEKWKDRDGNRKEKTEWHRVVIKNKPLVDLAEKYLRKGSKVYIEGTLETRKWQDQGGNDRYSTEIALKPYSSTMQFLDTRKSDQGGYDRTGDNEGGNSDAGSSYDDEIPF